MVAVAPGDIVFAVNKAYPRVIAILLTDNVLLPLEHDGLMVYVPVNAVLGEAGEDIHFHAPVIAAEDPGIAVPEGHHRGVENTV